MSAAVLPFERHATGIAGLEVLRPKHFKDQRGSFVKTFHLDAFQALGLPFEPREGFYSVSGRDVVRGMHFQVPPAAHRKLVYCIRGRILDVVVDLRLGSPFYRRVYSRELSSDAPELLFITVGLAHGFLSLEDESLVCYQTDVVHTPECDAGIAWDSIDFKWPVQEAVISERDRKLPRLEAFNTPFVWER